MANLSIREAVKLFDVSRPTLTKAIKNGVLSGIKDESGQWSIDHSELARVYKPRKAGVTNDGEAAVANFTIQNTRDSDQISQLKAALDLAEARATAAEQLAAERAAHIEDLRRMLPAPSTTPRRRWWPFG